MGTEHAKSSLRKKAKQPPGRHLVGLFSLSPTVKPTLQLGTLGGAAGGSVRRQAGGMQSQSLFIDNGKALTWGHVASSIVYEVDTVGH